MIERLGNLLCDIARWAAIIHGHFDNRSRIAAEQERAWMDAVAACRHMHRVDDTDHITIVRNRGNLFD